MQKDITQYISELDSKYQTGMAREHAYRSALETLLKTMLPDLIVVNEPARLDCGVPDLILQRKNDNITVAYVECKDIGDTDLTGQKKNKAQFERYKKNLDTIIFTDYLDFHLYERGEFVTSIRLAELKEEKIKSVKENVEKFVELIKRFGRAVPQTIDSAVKLAEIMADKALAVAKVIENALSHDLDNGKGVDDDRLAGQMTAYRDVLIHDISSKEFSDVYAQTIAYGMFAAWLHAVKPGHFNRKEAAELIPKTNPFLREFFQNIAGYNLDERITWIVDYLAEVFSVADRKAVMDNFGERTQQTDPMIHFYEKFLTAYDSSLRKSRGVWYTPQPVVSFIVRSVDEILQQKFGLPMGLADSSKTKITVKKESPKKEEITEKIEVHKVQILDPATGTGNFLAETVSQIHEKFRGQQGVWQSYVQEHLIPRLNGFEILMTPYAMAHIGLAWMLERTGHNPVGNQRFRIYLTNSLQEHHPDTGSFFHQFLAREANEANRVKRDTPVMVVMANPPYNVSTQNKNDWIDGLIAEYKTGLNEKNIQPLSDDYIKFIRLGQHYIERVGYGVLAYISNNSFIDGLIHRQMRKKLLEVFDDIYILDLHGNAMKKETAPDGGKDENVFDIRQGVSINIFIKTNRKATDSLATVFHSDLYCKRTEKYDFLHNNTLQTLSWQELTFNDENYFFVPKDFSQKEEYEKGFKVDELFQTNSSGVKTHDDSNLVNFIPFAENNQLYAYRPFDTRYLDYDLKKVTRHRYDLMKHFILGENLGLVIVRQSRTDDWSHVQITNNIIDNRLHYSNGIPVLCPLYLYSGKDSIRNMSRSPNLAPWIVAIISERLGLKYVHEKIDDKQTFAPIDILDYIYAVLHSPAYRERYKEFLKIDFPRVSYPADAKTFWKLVKVGEQLRRLHLMEEVTPQKGIANFPIADSNKVETLKYIDCKVYINDTQYFDNVPANVWNFYIGGYQPAQKWLKDRKGRTLSFDDIQHYQKIVAVLQETIITMGEIDAQ
jgi:predicted helicase